MLSKCCFDESFRPPPESGDGDGKVDSWDWGEALIDITAYMVEDRNHTSARCAFDDEEKEELQVTFRPAPPPHISYFCASGTPTESLYEPTVIATDGNLALITLTHHSAHPSTRNYFVYRAPFHGDKPIRSRLPRPSRELFLPSPIANCFLHPGEVCILRYSTNRRSQQPAFTPPTPSLTLSPATPLAGRYKPNLSSSGDDCDAYKVAALFLRFESARPKYDLCTYDSKVGAWSREPTAFSQPPPEGSPTHFSTKAITIGGAVAWVDLSHAILLCNVHVPGEEENPNPRQLRYIPLPERSRPDDHLQFRGSTASFRDVAAVQGCIKLVDIHIHASPGSLIPNGWTAVTWSMALDDSGFTKEADLHSRDIDGLLDPSLFVVHPTLSSQDGVLYLMAQADLRSDESRVISVNMKTKKLEGVAKFTKQRMASINFAFKSTSISRYLAPDPKRAVKRRGPAMHGSSCKKAAITFMSPNQPSGYGGDRVEEGLPSMGDDGDAMDLE